MDIRLREEQLNKLFPFHILIDHQVKITGFGSSIAKLFSLNSGTYFFDYFTIKRPESEDSSFNNLILLANQLLIIQYIGDKDLFLRGEVEYFEDTNSLLFLLTPWFYEVEKLKEYKIGLNDFAIHDSSIDLLHAFKSHEIATNDSKELLLKYQQQKNDLQRLSLIAEETFNSIVVTDNKARIEWVNRAFESLTGFTQKEVLGKTPGELLQGKETDPEIVAYLRKRIRAGLSFDCELINYNKQGNPYWIRLSGQPIKNKKGEVTQFFAFEEDITDRKLAEEKLEKQRHFYEDVLNNIPSDIVVFDKNHTYLFLNPIAIRDEVLRKWMIGKKDEDYFALRNKPLHLLQERKNLFNQVIQEKKLKVWEEELIDKDGEKEYHLRNMYPLLDENGEVKLVIGYGINITSRKIVEQELSIKEKQFRDLFNYSQALICTHDMKGRILSVNPALCITLGYDAIELVGKLLIDFIPEKDRDKFQPNYLDKIIQEEKAEGVFRVVNKDGSVLFLLFKNYRVEELGQEPYVIGFSQDITDRIKAEHELLVAKKMTEESAKAKEIFLANMSHEIRTPMHGILGIAGLLAKTNLNEEQQNYISLINESANNLVVIINDILDIEKIGSGKLTFESINFSIVDKLNTTLQSFQYKAAEKKLSLQLKYDFSTDLIVNGDPYRLSQVLNNLLSNALKFTKQGSITLFSTVQESSDDKIVVKFSVSDSGIGIPKNKQSIIFDPFVQASSDTTRKYGGTGLGLSICKNLVEMQGGGISVESIEHIGTTFSFSLPFKPVTKSIKSVENLPQIDTKKAYLKKILMAEDVVVNQFLGQSILESGGFLVDIANNGIEVLELIDKNQYDLILMDIQMPEMDGITATQKIRALQDRVKANIPIIALTANALVGNEKEYLEVGMNACLTKPFTEEKLFAAIASINNSSLHLRSE